MSLWRCLVITADGLSDWREVEALDEDAVLARLRAEGVLPIEISGSSGSLLAKLNQPIVLRRKLSVGDQALILSRLATLITSALPVDRSLDLLREQASRSRQRGVLTRMLATVREGGGLGRAFEAEGLFPAYVVGVIRAAERGGGLGDALRSVAERLSLATSTRRQMITALTYPAAILAATAAALAIVLIFVIPQFDMLFAGQEDKLPLATRWVLALSRALSGHPILVLASVALPPLLLILFARSVRGRQLVDRQLRHLPLLALRDQYLAAQFVGILATLLTNGIKIVEALPLARDAMGSERWRRYASRAEQAIREGTSLSTALSRDALLPITAIRLIEVGERSGRLAETCAQASNIIGETARARIERLVALANPIAIIMLGGLVAGLVGSVMLGIFALGDLAG